jgi:HK97 family phage major capsid protein
MNYAEMLKALRAQREAKIKAMTDLHTAAKDRTFTDEEQKSFDELSAQVDSIDKQIVSTEKMEKLAGDGARPVVPESNGNGSTTPASAGSSTEIRGAGRVVVQRNLPPGTAFTRYAMALAAAKGNLMQAAESAKQWEGSTPEVTRVLKAAVAAGTTTDAAWAAPLVDYRTMAEEFVELLRPATILGRMTGFRRVPFNVRIPRQTAGASVGWVGEAQPKPVSSLAFDTVTMPETKIAGIVVITMELARFSSPSAEALVRQDMIESIAQFSDAQFINPGVAGVAGVNPASITNGAQEAASTGSTLAEIEADLLAARMYFVNANIPLEGAYWVMSPSTKTYLEELRTTQDVLAFPTLGTNGTLKGIPVIASTGVGTYDQDGAGAGTAAKYIALISAPNVLVADDGQVMLDSSSEASIVMDDAGAGSTLTSLWQKNMLGIRAERLIHWLKRRTQAAYVIYNVTY